MHMLKEEVVCMAKTDIVHIRLEPTLKAGVEATLGKLGMSTAEAVNIFLHQVLLIGGLPFEVKLPKPNAQTLAAMEEARKVSKTGKGYTSAKEVMEELNS